MHTRTAGELLLQQTDRHTPLHLVAKTIGTSWTIMINTILCKADVSLDIAVAFASVSTTFLCDFTWLCMQSHCAKLVAQCGMCQSVYHYAHRLLCAFVTMFQQLLKCTITAGHNFFTRDSNGTPVTFSIFSASIMCPDSLQLILACKVCFAWNMLMRFQLQLQVVGCSWKQQLEACTCCFFQGWSAFHSPSTIQGLAIMIAREQGFWQQSLTCCTALHGTSLPISINSFVETLCRTHCVLKCCWSV